ncbi:hypothetical protein [Burkholderia ubonensis]|uniref:hypothetical protein n=1 Tax=Burkholderia ubonensis TaxID=101571 RepID=UPI0015A5AFDB|nr:hypothetical protein [Burkholderia ubonensis]
MEKDVLVWLAAGAAVIALMQCAQLRQQLLALQANQQGSPVAIDANGVWGWQ